MQEKAARIGCEQLQTLMQEIDEIEAGLEAVPSRWTLTLFWCRHEK